MSENQSYRILCVDDEPAVLAGLRRNLHGQFSIEIANSGPEALALIKNGESYAVVMSDMRMPKMNGTEFLREVKSCLPKATRLLLTGQADIPSAIAAINQAGIFRFLTKPCSKEDLVHALTDAIRQHELLLSEEVLLEQTLRSSLGVLAEALSMANPEAMKPILRLRTMVRELAEALGVRPSWDIEVASMFAHLCTLSLPAGLLPKFRRGYPLNAEEQAAVRNSNIVAQRLVSQIPRLGPVRDLLRHAGKLERNDQGEQGDTGNHGNVANLASGVLGARILLAALDYCGLLAAGVDSVDALGTLLGREHKYGKDVLAKLLDLRATESIVIVRAVNVSELRPGMTIVDPVRTRLDLVITAAETKVTEQLAEQLLAFNANDGLAGPLLVRYPP